MCLHIVMLEYVTLSHNKQRTGVSGYLILWEKHFDKKETENIKAFLSLKDAHLKDKNMLRNIDAKTLFEQQKKFRPRDEEICQRTERYCCRKCFHFKTKNCDGLSDLKRSCSYWYDPNSEIIGLAYG